MKTANLLLGYAVLLGVLAMAEPTRAELNYPTVGKTTIYECTGPYGRQQTLAVVWIKDGIIREEGHSSGRGDTFVEQELLGVGTTLFKQRDRADNKGVNGQSYKEDDFKGYELLVPGSSYKGTVRAWRRSASWRWLYSIEVREAKTINHPVFGDIEVVPVLEKREILGSTYRSTLNMLVYPELGIELKFTYKDGKRDYECDLVSYD